MRPAEPRLAVSGLLSGLPLRRGPNSGDRPALRWHGRAGIGLRAIRPCGAIGLRGAVLLREAILLLRGAVLLLRGAVLLREPIPPRGAVLLRGAILLLPGAILLLRGAVLLLRGAVLLREPIPPRGAVLLRGAVLMRAVSLRGAIGLGLRF